MTVRFVTDETVAETLISCLLEYSSIEADTPFRFVCYRMERMNVHGRDRNGCSSADFLQPGESIITLSHLSKREGHPLQETLMRVSSDKKRIAWLAEETAALTGLDNFPQYLTLLFELDALFLNSDRHWNKIAVLEKMGALTTVPSLTTEQDFYPKNSTPSGFGGVLLYIFPPGTTKQAGAGFVPALLLL